MLINSRRLPATSRYLSCNLQQSPAQEPHSILRPASNRPRSAAALPPPLRCIRSSDIACKREKHMGRRTTAALTQHEPRPPHSSYQLLMKPPVIGCSQLLHPQKAEQQRRRTGNSSVSGSRLDDLTQLQVHLMKAQNLQTRDHSAFGSIPDRMGV